MDKRLPRKLAAILYADVADYSRLTGEDEDATHQILRSHLDFISSAIEKHSGRVVHYAGDAVLADFGTVLDALQCATYIQAELGERNARYPDLRKLQFRIGVNLGDVIVDQHEIYGDGVNVAARLESLAEPGGICISEAVRTAIGNKLPLEYDDMGEQRVKNIERSVHAYRPRLKPGGEPPVAPAPSARSRIGRRIVIATVVVALGLVLLLWSLPSQRDELPEPVAGAEIVSPDETDGSIMQGELPGSDPAANSVAPSDDRLAEEQPAPPTPDAVKQTQPEIEAQASAPVGDGPRPGQFLSEDEIRNTLVGNTIRFVSPRDGRQMHVFFAAGGGVAVKAENNPRLVDIHKWFFEDGDVFCRTILADRRSHCTRIIAADDAGSLNFVNAKMGVFYTATVLEGRQIPE